MNPTDMDQRGTMIQGRDRWRIDNALVEEVSTSNGRTGSLLVSYAVKENRGLVRIEKLQLNVNRNTTVRNQFGLPVCLCDIKPGMWVNAEFSPMMTRSIPPQTNAFHIMVRNRMPNPAPPPAPPPPCRPPGPKPQPPCRPPGPQPPPERLTFVDRIVSVDSRNRTLLVGPQNNVNRQMRFVVTNETVILDRNRNRITLQMLRPGQLVEVTHANFQTASIPPQTTAFSIQVL